MSMPGRSRCRASVDLRVTETGDGFPGGDGAFAPRSVAKRMFDDRDGREKSGEFAGFSPRRRAVRKVPRGGAELRPAGAQQQPKTVSDGFDNGVDVRGSVQCSGHFASRFRRGGAPRAKPRPSG